MIYGLILLAVAAFIINSSMYQMKKEPSGAKWVGPIIWFFIGTGIAVAGASVTLIGGVISFWRLVF